MKISQKYVDYVKKTAKPNYTVEMAACALLEEWGEFLESKTTDELGDVLYQFALFCQVLGFDVCKLKSGDGEGSLLTCVLKITSQYKKKVTRGKDIDSKLIEKCLCKIYYVIMSLIAMLWFNIEDVEEENMKKLNERYGTND